MELVGRLDKTREVVIAVHVWPGLLPDFALVEGVQLRYAAGGAKRHKEFNMKLPDLWITVLLFPLTITPLYAEPADPGPSILTPLTSNEASHWPPPGESMLPTRLRLIEAIDVDGDGQMSDDEVSDTPNALRSLDSDTNSAVDAKRPRWKPQGRRGPRPWGRGPPVPPNNSVLVDRQRLTLPPLPLGSWLKWPIS